MPPKRTKVIQYKQMLRTTNHVHRMLDREEDMDVDHIMLANQLVKLERKLVNLTHQEVDTVEQIILLSYQIGRSEVD